MENPERQLPIPAFGKDLSNERVMVADERSADTRGRPSRPRLLWWLLRPLAGVKPSPHFVEHEGGQITIGTRRLS